jgi:hypothetical protein
MSPACVIEKNGRRLIALVRLGQVLTVLGAFLTPYVLYRIAEPVTHQSFLAFMQGMLKVPGLVAVNGWGIFKAIVFIWALDRIRLIGAALIHHSPISLDVVVAVRGTAYAWLIYAATALFKLELEPRFGVAPADYNVGWSFDLQTFLVVCLLSSCALTISRILDAAAELQNENRGFI